MAIDINIDNIDCIQFKEFWNNPCIKAYSDEVPDKTKHNPIGYVEDFSDYYLIDYNKSNFYILMSDSDDKYYFEVESHDYEDESKVTERVYGGGCHTGVDTFKIKLFSVSTKKLEFTYSEEDLKDMKFQITGVSKDSIMKS